MSVPASLTEALLERCADDAGATALVVPGGGAAAAGRLLSYGELDRRARSLAARLQRDGQAGRPVLVPMTADGPEPAVAVLGCLYAGAVAVPVPPPGDSRADLERTAAIAEETGAGLVLTRAASAPAVSRQFTARGTGSPVCLAVDHGAAPDPGEWRPPRLAGGDPALIQYTSGSTAAPRGVTVTQSGLLAAVAAAQAALRTGRASRIGGWLPLHHGPALVAQLLHPLRLGAAAVLPGGHAADRPLHWLAETALHGVTAVLAPDSVYARCLAEATDADLERLDLSRLETAVSATEPVSAAVLTAFAARFARAGLRPGVLACGYSPAEACLSAVGAVGDGSVRRSADAAELEAGRLRPAAPGARARAVVGGRPVPAVEIRVVDPASRAELPDGAVGEVWVRGPSVGAGYWRRPLETAESFGCATAAGAGGFLRTGDLGALWDGVLYVTGRTRDTLTVHGRALHPQEVERLLAGGPRLVSAAVFAVGDGLEHLVAVQEVRGSAVSSAELSGAARQVRRCLAEEFGATADGLLLVRPGTVRRATAGRVSRSVVRELFLRGELRSLHTELSPGLADWLAGAAGAGRGLR
ncbi:AMP-binding protein [Streptacidiphilus sp. ASG 303]|uniref:AMP-binding protein n=1 Tax=Streptacidiphilus sp. ASG 303 TaxID=2896847 RepID=UPI001E50EBA9|nr:AMP-binding protein [Streptacidiphilus sp. ASG 303]MCD0486330.1 AMP-binding protein [Streptacidiphilus sp. ASG 303]